MRNKAYEILVAAVTTLATLCSSGCGGIEEPVPCDAEGSCIAGFICKAGICVEVWPPVRMGEREDEPAGPDAAFEGVSPLDFLACHAGDSLPCIDTVEDACLIGRLGCEGGRWGRCEAESFADSMDVCGRDCAGCHPNMADACTFGRCTCGDEVGCVAGQMCCSATCVDIYTDADNCGDCGSSCAEQLQNTLDPACQEGACTYETCRPGFLECNRDVRDGCETQVDVKTCGACDLDCTERVLNVTRVLCDTDEDLHACDYKGAGVTGEGCDLGFLDCDGDRSNGCETPVSNEHCGACGSACTIGCLLVPETEGYACACSGDADCGDERTPHCCGAACSSLPC